MKGLKARTQATESKTSSDVTLTHKATVCVTATRSRRNPETPIRLYNTTDDEFYNSANQRKANCIYAIKFLIYNKTNMQRKYNVVIGMCVFSVVREYSKKTS
jgi:hypothetical protein